MNDQNGCHGAPWAIQCPKQFRLHARVSFALPDDSGGMRSESVAVMRRERFRRRVDGFPRRRQIEADSRLSVRGIGTVTGEAPVRKNRPDVAIEFDGLTGRRHGESDAQQRKRAEPGHISRLQAVYIAR